ncbi:hypothetical protein F511_35549 [Dorcoceras hygrometricum]|uniref:Uncharacterized protein n=1 Tax=Dorcoceras hygrometricum TaxID=472368 RepID=A0A2Z7B5N0_9LAMI|nr:hypothetical protein F511_35549 [Dorcoceras hygrometricum]
MLVKIVPIVKKLTMFDLTRILDLNGKKLLKFIQPLALMVSHILMAMGVQTDAATQWNSVRPNLFPRKS